MHQATGRDPDDVATSARCLLAYRCIFDPTPEQVAGACIEAFHYLDTFALRRLWES